MFKKIWKLLFGFVVGGGLGFIIGALAEDMLRGSMNLGKGELIGVVFPVGVIVGVTLGWRSASKKQVGTA